MGLENHGATVLYTTSSYVARARSDGSVVFALGPAVELLLYRAGKLVDSLRRE
jgi:hypothetical protein